MMIKLVGAVNLGDRKMLFIGNTAKLVTHKWQKITTMIQHLKNNVRNEVGNPTRYWMPLSILQILLIVVLLLD